MSRLLHPRRALLSVYDKTGVVELARALAEQKVDLLSTGGTCQMLRASGLPVREISDYTGFPELMDGRVKTLHPKVHGGLLGRINSADGGDDGEAMAAHDIAPIDLVVVNLYPFAQTVADPGCSLQQAVEQIDIGGPAMLRSAAKNHARVTALCDPQDYERVIQAVRGAGISAQLRYELAHRAFSCTAAYDGAIANWLGSHQPDGHALPFADALHLSFPDSVPLRYGENPHQQARFYRLAGPVPGSLAAAQQRGGKALSYNNIADADLALACVRSFTEPACVIVKHANPCGVAVADTPLGAYESAFAADPESAFGGVIAMNRQLDEQVARQILANQFAEVIVAPDACVAAQQALSAKKNLRLLVCGAAPDAGAEGGSVLRQVSGGLLVQQADIELLRAEDLRVVTRRAPTDAELRDLQFAWQVVRFVKSNAIVYARNRATVGIGVGQSSRVFSVRSATLKAQAAGLLAEGEHTALASDAFFPFADGVQVAAQAGITALIQPGGSVRDAEVIAAADAAGMAMVCTGRRHFRH